MPKRVQRAVGALAAGLVLAGTAFAGQVTGKYVGNGKAAKLAYAVVQSHEPWNGEPAYVLVLSEKDPSASKDADTDAMFGKLGDALSITITKSGKMLGAQVCHQSLKKAGFSTSGTIEVEGFKVEGGSLSGRFHTTTEQDFFGDKYELDLTAKAALPTGK